MTLPKGLKIRDLRPGHGRVAERGTIAIIEYDCFLPRGDRCFSSRPERWPVQLEIGKRNHVVALNHGVEGMAAGGIRSIKVPPQLAYYERTTRPEIPERASLRYEVELLAVLDEWDNHQGVRFRAPTAGRGSWWRRLFRRRTRAAPGTEP